MEDLKTDLADILNMDISVLSDDFAIALISDEKYATDF